MAAGPSILAIGMMSGTSTDGIDAALVRVWASRGRFKVDFIDGTSFQYPKALRERLLAACSPATSSVKEICSLHFELGEAHAALAASLITDARDLGLDPDIVSMHGHTVQHMGEARSLRDGLITSTLQIGQPAVVAQATGVTVISDLRAADIAAGGHGAPLTSFADAHLFQFGGSGAIVQNIGGIANFTAIPPEGSALPVISFDTGPGNMLIDLVAGRASNGEKTFDADGGLARSGIRDTALLARLLRHPFVRMQPPKTTGREEFGEGYFAEVLEWPEASGLSWADLAATMTEFTVRCIAESARRFVTDEYRVKTAVIGGGGSRNPFLMERLRHNLTGVEVKTHEDVGIPGQFKECIAFAILGAATVAGIPGNIPSCTGAGREVVLGSITPGENYDALWAGSAALRRAWLADRSDADE